MTAMTPERQSTLLHGAVCPIPELGHRLTETLLESKQDEGSAWAAPLRAWRPVERLAALAAGTWRALYGGRTVFYSDVETALTHAYMPFGAAVYARVYPEDGDVPDSPAGWGQAVGSHPHTLLRDRWEGIVLEVYDRAIDGLSAICRREDAARRDWQRMEDHLLDVMGACYDVMVSVDTFAAAYVVGDAYDQVERRRKRLEEQGVDMSAFHAEAKRIWYRRDYGAVLRVDLMEARRVHHALVQNDPTVDSLCAAISALNPQPGDGAAFMEQRRRSVEQERKAVFDFIHPRGAPAPD